MQNIRNFCIISHIDHGKSTLADRFLELTSTVPEEKMREQFLDMMPLEREKGITIKMQPVRMEYNGYILNLIDTPGHVDFSYEVSRALACVEGAILLVDATKGIQAQTIANLELAKKQNLIIIPTVNKIDLPNAQTEKTLQEILNFGIRDISGKLVQISDILKISAKYGTNVENLLKAVIEKIPSPKGNLEKPFKALIFDSKYDSYKGVVAFIRVVEGQIAFGKKIYLIQAKSEGEIKELGYFKPDLKPAKELKAGEMGYIATGIKEPGKVKVGDTITKMSNVKAQMSNIEPLPGYQEPKPMVFLSIYPENPNDFEELRDSLAKLILSDPALTFKPELKEGLGRGFQCGFLGLLHAEIVTERLKREFDLNLFLSTPSVTYKIITQNDQELLIFTPTDWPETTKIKESQELWVQLRVLTPISYLGDCLSLLENIESRQIKTNYLSPEKVELIYEAPLREIINKNFYDKLKSLSQGFSSMDYQILGWQKSNLVKLNILIGGKKEEALSRIVSEKEAHREGKRLVEKLKEILPPQLFAVLLQAQVGGKIIARETMRAQRRDVIAPLYGGDYTRKRKLLEKQKKGKQKLKERGQIRISPQVFLELFKAE